MSKALTYIRKKVGSIQFGILRCRDEEKKESWQVKINTGKDGCLQCVVDGDIPEAEMTNKYVNLVQKDDDNYLYITGKVEGGEKKDAHMISISILKACWFIRRSRGNVSWLQEKYVYEGLIPDDISMAS